MLKPIGVDAAVKAVNALMQKTSAAQRQLELALQKQRSMSLTPADKTMLLIQPIGWWQANWSAAGTQPLK